MLRDVGESVALVAELSVVVLDSPGTPMSVVDSRTLVGKLVEL
ncbi:Uncharacterised protein [Mycolicibacterium tokaiense]|uniref:Uncharacterized protein n=1 Tax=Mycolicibacterium tokaiense TaxID=39695 RepID=A0A378TI18_9MYCO|nr:hypothetical protein MTOK_08740 [Mycolicibacterium tokaiense]STZ60399.1 Uncharacterised protein [Mycolicibacterium tokaiense]